MGLTKITPFCGNKRTFLQTPPIPIYRPAFHPPPPPKRKQPTCIFTAYHSRSTDELDTLSDSSSLPNSARLIIPQAPTRRRLKKHFFLNKKFKKKLCIVFKLFCLVNNFMIWKRKKKERKKKKKKKLLMVVAGFEPWIYGLWNSRLTTELQKPTSPMYITKYIFIFNMASRTIQPLTCAIPQFQFWLKKNLIKCIIKVVNVSKSQYYQFRHNIMNLGNQNSKYSWRICDLENPQTRTQFANSILMYKMQFCSHKCLCVLSGTSLLYTYLIALRD